MKRLLLLLTLALVASACESLDPKAQTVRACKEILVPSLLDIESYRERSEYEIVQSEKDNPIVYGWEWNSRNSMGGYTQPNTQLCYREKEGNIVTQNFEIDDLDGMEVFLRVTSPKLQKKEQDRLALIAEEEQNAKAARQQEVAARRLREEQARQNQLEAARRAEAGRRAVEQANSASLINYCKKLNGNRPNFQGISELKWPTDNEDTIYNACSTGKYNNTAITTWRTIRNIINR